MDGKAGIYPRNVWSDSLISPENCLILSKLILFCMERALKNLPLQGLKSIYRLRIFVKKSTLRSSSLHINRVPAVE